MIGSGVLWIAIGECKRERFFVSEHACGAKVRVSTADIFSAFSRVVDVASLLVLRFRHVAGFVSVPWPAGHLKARPPGGARKSDHANQQEHNTGHKKASITHNDFLHPLAKKPQSCPCNTLPTIMLPDLPAGKMLGTSALGDALSVASV